MEKNIGEGGVIIDLAKKRKDREKSKKDAKLQERWEHLQNELESYFTANGMIFVRNDEGVITGLVDMKKENYAFDVDPNLIAQGWNVCGAFEINEDLLEKKKELLELIKWKKVITKKSNYKFDHRPAIVFYGKN